MGIKLLSKNKTNDSTEKHSNNAKTVNVAKAGAVQTSSIKKSKGHKSRQEKDREKLLGENSSFYIKEAYKTLRTNITFSMPYTGCRKLMVASSLASEGKSLNCMNVALTFAETGAKVLLVDCDLRRPNVHRLLNLDATPGLSNYLINMNTIEEIIKHPEGRNIDVITSGDIPPNPAELLGSDRFREFVSKIEQNYDIILFDTCPVNIVTDTAILSKIIPEVVVVALQNSTEKDSLKDAVDQLEFSGAKIIGFILNGVEYTSKGGYKYRYGRKYYRIGGRYSRNYGYYDRYGYGSGGYGQTVKKRVESKSTK